MKNKTLKHSGLIRKLVLIDYRALALFRIFLGLILLFDLLSKAQDLTAFYTDRGILSRGLAIQYLGWWSFSFHMASGAYWFQLLLLSLGLLLCVFLILGYQTRVITVLTWLFFVSLQGRNHIILHSGDALIRLMLFWSMFLPMQARYSLDNLCFPNGSKYKDSGISNLASAAILLQLLYMYFFTALLKNHPDWNQNFQAVYYALSLEQFTTPFGHFLSAYPQLLALLTILTLSLEFLGPILLLVPFFQAYLRVIIPFSFIGLHVSLFLTMYLGMFPWICIVSWFLFFPNELMNFLEKKIIKPYFSNTYFKRLVRHLPAPMTWQQPQIISYAINGFICSCMLGVLAWNINALPNVKEVLPKFAKTIMLPLRLDQYWSMFAPYPMRADGWFVVEGVLKDGSEYDTWNNMAVSWEKPAAIFSLYRSTQWRKAFTNIWIEKNTREIRLAFARYICREWNDLSNHSEEKKLNTYKLYFMKEYTMPLGQTSEVKKLLKWTHDCYANTTPASESSPPKIKN